MDLRARTPIIVAVHDSRSSDDAVDWAAAEAAVQRAPLRVVHALAPNLTLDPYGAGAMIECTASARSVAEQVLHNAVLRATSVARENDVSTGVLDGTVTWALGREARPARLLVVGSHGRRAGLRELLTGSVPARLAGHAPCPIIVVPRLGDPVAGATRVVVGVSRGGSSSAAIGFAFRAARQRGIPLTLVHVCRFQPAPGARDMVVDLAALDKTLRDRAAAQTIARWHEEIQDVPVIAKLIPGEPASVLISESAGAAMLVLGSRGRVRLLGRRLGSVGQAVLENAGCPIAIVRQDHTTTAPSDDLQRAEAHSAPR
jgi:nucleotide-binding universal stress UspA family protein